jgi:hypothetical protein
MKWLFRNRFSLFDLASFAYILREVVENRLSVAHGFLAWFGIAVLSVCLMYVAGTSDFKRRGKK